MSRIVADALLKKTIFFNKIILLFIIFIFFAGYGIQGDLQMLAKGVSDLKTKLSEMSRVV